MHNTRQDFLIVQAAVIPTSVLPAPQGRTMIPERARLDEWGKGRVTVSDNDLGFSMDRVEGVKKAS